MFFGDIMDFIINNNVKLETLTRTRPVIENALYEVLLLQGFDPDNFDPDTFVPESGNLDHQTITMLVQKYQNIVLKIAELQG